MSARTKTLYITPTSSMDFSSGKGVVRGRGGAGGSSWDLPCSGVARVAMEAADDEPSQCDRSIWTAER